jgi:hypothetical protein
MSKVAYEPAEGFTRVELTVQHLDEPVVVDGTFETDDLVLQRELDEHPCVRRAETKPRKGGEQ